MRGFLAFLIVLPVVIFGGALAWVAGSQPKAASARIETPSLGEPPETEDAAVRKGWEVFTSKGCVYCHGPGGTGGVANPNSQGGRIPALTKVYEGYSEEELKTRILTGVPDVAKENPAGPTPPLYMPAWKGHLTDEELDAVVKYLFSFKPAGGGEEW